MKNKHTYILLGIILLFIWSCKKSKGFKSAGEPIQVTRQLNDFNSLELYNSINVVLIQDSVNKVVLSGGKNLLPYITTEIKNGKLILKDQNKMNWLRSFKKKITAELHFKQIDKILYHGAGDISTKDTLRSPIINITSRDGTGSIHLNFSGDSAFVYIHTGSADVHIKGKAKRSYIYCLGTGFIYIDKLSCRDVFVNNSGTGNFYIAPTHDLGVEIYSLGNVFCHTKPHLVYKTITGKGNLIYR